MLSMMLLNGLSFYCSKYGHTSAVSLHIKRNDQFYACCSLVALYYKMITNKQQLYD